MSNKTELQNINTRLNSLTDILREKAIGTPSSGESNAGEWVALEDLQISTYSVVVDPDQAYTGYLELDANTIAVIFAVESGVDNSLLTAFIVYWQYQGYNRIGLAIAGNPTFTITEETIDSSNYLKIEGLFEEASAFQALQIYSPV